MPRSSGAYGSRRMHQELKRRWHRIGVSRVERLMREAGIGTRHKRRFKATTDSKHKLPVAANLLARNFKPLAPNQVWTGNITYIPTADGWLYLAVVLDLFNREIVGWSIKPRITADIVTDAPSMARSDASQRPVSCPLQQRPRQPRATRCADKLAEYGMTASMSRKGNCWDNAPTESFFNSMKNERSSRHSLFYNRTAPPLHAGLQLADSVPHGLAQQAGRSAIEGGTRAAGWKPKGDGHPKQPLHQARASPSSARCKSCADQAIQKLSQAPWEAQ